MRPAIPDHKLSRSTQLAGPNVFAKIVFLPFVEWWSYFIMFTTLFTFSASWVDFIFEFKTDWTFVYYCCEFFFTVNTVGLIAHKYLKKLRRSRVEQPVNAFLLLLCALSLIPCYEILYVLHLHTWESYKPIDVYRIKVTLRLGYIVHLFLEKSNSVGVNHVLLLVVKHIVRLILTTTVLCCVWYKFACYMCEEPNWSDVVIKPDRIDINNTLHWWIISYHITSSILAHNWLGVIVGSLKTEWIFVIFAMLLGFMLHIMIFFGELAGALSHLHTYQFNFTFRLRKTMDLLQDWNVDQKIKKRVVEYYNFFWEKRRGEKHMPQALQLLPMSLRKAVTLDIFWDALRHSHLFTDTDISFKRTVSMMMKSEFMVPGEYIYHADEMKSKLYYIVSGVVQVLSSEDNESPYLSLSAGTLLGEFAIFRPMQCTATVKCATYCEFQTLCTKSLVGILADNRMIARELRSKVSLRIDIAKKLDIKNKRLRGAQENDVSMRRFKHQWRAVYAIHINKKHEDEESLWQKLDSSFYSMYLDFIVMSEQVELMIQAICLTSRCPLIMDPHSGFHHFCDWLVLISVSIQFLLVPKYAFFDYEITNNQLVMLFILDMIYYFDIYLQLTTAIKYQSKIVSEFSKILLHRAVQLTFIVDVIATLPYPLILQYIKMQEWSLIGRVPRVLKIYKLFVFIDEKLKSPWHRNLHLKIIKHIFLHLVNIYTFSTILYAFSCFKNICNPIGWYSQGGFPISENFLASIYHISSLYLGIGISDITSYLLEDVILITVVVYVGYFLFTFSMADVTASTVLNVRKSYAHQDEIEIMDHLMKQRSINVDLRKRLMNILNFNWQLNEGIELHGAHGILNFSETLKAETYTDRILKTLKMVPLFQSFDDQVVKYCAAQVKISVLPPGIHLMNANILAMTLYVIVRGNCSMMSDLPGDRERKNVVILKRGDLLAPLELLHRIKSFVTIQTITAVEVLEMPYDLFHDILRNHPTTYKPLMLALNEHKEKYQNTLYKKGCRLPPMVAVAPALGTVDSFSYKIYKRKFYTIDEYTRPFIEMKHWSWLRYILLRRTIDPKGKFFVGWEVFRIMTILVDAVIGLLTANLLAYQILVSDMIITCFCVISAVDVYIRLHCQYYNDYGILVTHPLFTAKHYIQCSFPIDVIQTLPHFVLKSAYLFGTGNTMQAQAMIRISLRSLQIYRFYKSVTYLESLVSWSWGAFIIKAKYSVFLVVILLFMSNILMIVTCSFPKIAQDEYTVNCSGVNWITTSGLSDNPTTSTVFLQSTYLIVLVYASAICGTFGIGHYHELKTFIAMILLLTLIRWVVFAGFTSCTTGGGINLSTYQARMKQFLKFAKEVRLQDHLIKEMVAHNEMVWKQTQGSNVMTICAKFNNFQRSQFICFLYESTLRATHMMETASEPFLLAVAQRLQEVHFKKGSDIIRCNDVQGYMYIVHTGRVEIFVANCSLASLEKGAVFGCFSATDSERHMISAKAKRHITVLAIKSNEFHKLLKYWKNEPAEDILNVIVSTRQEYDLSLISTEPQDVHYQKYMKSIKGNKKRYHKYLEYFNRIIPVSGKVYWFWRYLLCVHISFLSSILALLNMSIDYINPTETIPNILFLLSDLIYAFNLVLGFSLYHLDPFSGVLEKIGKNIALRYLKTWFTFDLLMCLPFEEIGKLSAMDYSKFTGINRPFRYFYLMHYYNKCNEKLAVSKHLRWTYLIYKTLFYIQLTASVWLILGCAQNSCKYVINTEGRPRDFKEASSTGHSVAVAYTYIINMFSSTGLRAISPYTTHQLVIAILIAFLIQYIIATLASGFATLIMVENNTKMRYQHKIDILKGYLKGQNLSPSILKLVWEYLLQLWKMQRGEWVPTALYEAPAYLKQDIMESLYMSHLESHFLFADTHVDFLRQLVVHLQRCIYLPGNYIVESGDLDTGIYFIHRGEVAAYTVSGNDETQCYILSANMSFGEAQGLQKMPYQHSYKAITIVEVLILKKESWDYLLQHFPASFETIKAKSVEYGMMFGATYAGRTLNVAQASAISIVSD